MKITKGQDRSLWDCVFCSVLALDVLYKTEDWRGGGCAVLCQCNMLQLMLHKTAAVDGWAFLSSIPEKGQ